MDCDCPVALCDSPAQRHPSSRRPSGIHWPHHPDLRALRAHEGEDPEPLEVLRISGARTSAAADRVGLPGDPHAVPVAVRRAKRELHRPRQLHLGVYPARDSHRASQHPDLDHRRSDRVYRHRARHCLPHRPDEVRRHRQVPHLHADGDLVRRGIHHLEVRLHLPARPEQGRHRVAERDLQGGGADAAELAARDTRSTRSCSSPSWSGSRPDSPWSCSRPR